MADNILSDFGINLLEEEVDDVISRPTSSCAMPRSQGHKVLLVDSSDVHGTGCTLCHRDGGWHGL